MDTAASEFVYVDHRAARRGATPGARNPNGVFGRFQYVPEYDVFLLATMVRGPVVIFKPLDLSPPS